MTSPWGIVLVVVVVYLVVRVPRISPGPMSDHDMPTILAELEADHSLAAVLSWFTGSWVQDDMYYRPLSSLVHWANFMLADDDGFYWRLVNALIIAATMPALVWMFAVGFGRPWAGVITAGLLPWFRPLDQMVSFPAWRTELLSALFLILATGAGLSYLREGRRQRLIFMLAMLLVALGFKEVSFAWPAFFAVACLFVRRDLRTVKAIGGAFGLAAAVWLMRVHFLGHPLLGAPIRHVDFPLARQLEVFVRMLFAPVYEHIVMVYPTLAESWYFLLSRRFYEAVFLDLLFIFVNVVLLLRAPRVLGVIWVWRIILYLPSMPFANIFPFYLYIPIVGTVMLYGVAFEEVARMLCRRYAVWLRERGLKVNSKPKDAEALC